MAATIPMVDFSVLGSLPETYRRAQLSASRDATLKQAIGPDGSIDYGRVLGGLAQAGDIEGILQFGRVKQAADERAAEREWRQAESARAQRNWEASYALQKSAAEGEKVPSGFRRTAAGGLEPVPGGPTDPTYIAQTMTMKEKPRQFNFGDIGKLNEEGQKYSTINRFADTFEDRFGGYGGQTSGNIATWAGRYLPEATVGKDVAEGAAWWQSYDDFKNVVRKELAGTAQSAQETANFERANINPGMTPKQIRTNLARQQEIATRMVKNKANSLIQAGYDPSVISAAYGLNLGNLGVQTTRVPRGGAPQPAGGGISGTGAVQAAPAPSQPVRVNTPEDAMRLPPGTVFITPDGRQKVRP